MQCLGNGERHSSYAREGPPIIIGGMILDIHAKAAKIILDSTNYITNNLCNESRIIAYEQIT